MRVERARLETAGIVGRIGGDFAMQTLHVAADHEMLSRAADEDRAKLPVAFEYFRRDAKILHHLERKSVVRLRPVQRQDTEFLVELDQERVRLQDFLRQKSLASV